MNESASGIGAGIAIAFIVMTVLWLIQQKTRNAGIVDVGWSLTIPFLALIYVLTSGNPGETRGLIAAAMVTAWGGRLAWHIHHRSRGKPEDARYAALRQAWGQAASWKFFVFFQFQALVAVFFSCPFLVVSLNGKSDYSGLEVAGVLLWAVALAGEASADRQLARFRRTRSSSREVCQEGWWHYSRHPNYFFEWLIWCGIALYALASPNGMIALACPVLMLFFLFKVTGIPATEEQSLRTKGDAYRHYQQTTSVFIPWFKKEG